MNYKEQPAIVIHREHGVMLRVVTNIPGAVDAVVFDVEDGRAQHARFVLEAVPEDDLPSLISKALDSLIKHGLGMGAGVVCERFRKIEWTQFASAREADDAWLAVFEEARQIYDAAKRGRSFKTDDAQEPRAQPPRLAVRR
jgi:hypothetical protein